MKRNESAVHVARVARKFDECRANPQAVVERATSSDLEPGVQKFLLKSLGSERAAGRS